MKPQKVLVFEQNGSGTHKVQGVKAYGGDRILLERWDINQPLPAIIDDTTTYLPERVEADLVLDFLKHPDLSYDLANACQRLKVPVVASGKKMRVDGVMTPPT